MPVPFCVFICISVFVCFAVCCVCVCMCGEGCLDCMREKGVGVIVVEASGLHLGVPGCEPPMTGVNKGGCHAGHAPFQVDH